MNAQNQLRFTIAGKHVTLSKQMVEDAMKEVTPEPIKKWWVSIGGVHFPIKQVVAAVIGLPTAAFISTDAYRVLRRLGFEIKS
jgi:hypothetical protein